jgi:DNA-binding IclR family transcriptional regulator
MGTTEPRRRGIKSVETCFDIVNVVTESDSATLTDIAEELDISPSTVHEHLRTLEERGLIVQTREGYQLGLKFLDYGTRAKERKAISTVAEPLLEELADETGEYVTLLVEERGYGVIIDRAAGRRAIEPIGKVGRHISLHCIASGKAILANLPNHRVESIVEKHGLPEKTANTTVDREELWAELDAIRNQNLAFEDEEIADGIRAVGAPIVCEGRVQAAIDVSGPANRMQNEKLRDDIPDLLLGAANELELRLTHEETV